jgi:hypothetical protein
MQSAVMVHGELSRLENPARFRTPRAIPACSLPFRRISRVLALLLEILGNDSMSFVD